MRDGREGRAILGGIPVGASAPVAVMGVLNLSADSFYQGSVVTSTDGLLRAAEAMVAAGASLLDVGARSTAPYRTTDTDEDAEAEALARAVEFLAARVDAPVSADTTRARPARAALERGARILNDVRGLADDVLAGLAVEFKAGLVLGASPESPPPAGPGPVATPAALVGARLARSLARALAAGVPEERIVLDPGIGFFRHGAVPWPEWDVRVLADLGDLRRLGRPLCVGVSRKSFLGSITGRADPDERLAGSLAAATIAVLHGAAMIRTHDVAETVDAVRVAERVRPLPGS